MKLWVLPAFWSSRRGSCTSGSPRNVQTVCVSTFMHDVVDRLMSVKCNLCVKMECGVCYKNYIILNCKNLWNNLFWTKLVSLKSYFNFVKSKWHHFHFCSQLVNLLYLKLHFRISSFLFYLLLYFLSFFFPEFVRFHFSISERGRHWDTLKFTHNFRRQHETWKRSRVTLWPPRRTTPGPSSQSQTIVAQVVLLFCCFVDWLESELSDIARREPRQNRHTHRKTIIDSNRRPTDHTKGGYFLPNFGSIRPRFTWKPPLTRLKRCVIYRRATRNRNTIQFKQQQRSCVPKRERQKRTSGQKGRVPTSGDERRSSCR